MWRHARSSWRTTSVTAGSSAGGAWPCVRSRGATSVRTWKQSEEWAQQKVRECGKRANRVTYKKGEKEGMNIESGAGCAPMIGTEAKRAMARRARQGEPRGPRGVLLPLGTHSLEPMNSLHGWLALSLSPSRPLALSPSLSLSPVPSNLSVEWLTF